MKLYKNTEWKNIEMYGEKTNIPTDWDVTNISSISKIISGGTPPTKENKFWGGTITWVTPVEIGKLDSLYIEKSFKNITSEGAEKIKNKKLIKDDLIITTRGTVGNLALASKEMYFNQSCEAIRVKENYNSLFLYFYLLLNKSILINNSDGTTFNAINKQNLGKFDCLSIDLKEQMKISSLILRQYSIVSNTRKLIQKLNTRNKFLTEQLLSGHLRIKKESDKKIFYKNLEKNWNYKVVNDQEILVPKDWNTFYLGSSNLPFVKSGAKKYTGIIDYYATGEVEDYCLGKKPTGSFTYDEKPSRANVQVVDNSIYFARMKNTLKIIKFEKSKNILLSTGFLGLTPKNNEINLDFLYYIIQSDYFQTIKNKECKGATQETLSDSSARQIELSFPHITEQTLIANTLNSLYEETQKYEKTLEEEEKAFTFILGELMSGRLRITL